MIEDIYRNIGAILVNNPHIEAMLEDNKLTQYFISQGDNRKLSYAKVLYLLINIEILAH